MTNEKTCFTKAHSKIVGYKDGNHGTFIPLMEGWLMQWRTLIIFH